MQLTELFDAPYRYKLRTSSPTEKIYYFKDQADKTVEVRFVNFDDDDYGDDDYIKLQARFGDKLDAEAVQKRTADCYEVDFYRGGYGITKAGDATKIFATVLAVIKDFINDKHPAELTFSAKEPSRIKLYDTMLKRISGYTVKAAQGTNSVKVYLLTKK